MKGQYFSFDAIIATVIMVIAFSTLVSYWYGVQSTIETRTDSQYSDALRVADSLFSPGLPSNWETYPISPASPLQQIGLANSFSNDLNKTKVKRLAISVGFGPTFEATNYTTVAKLLRLSADPVGNTSGYYILIEPIDARYGR